MSVVWVQHPFRAGLNPDLVQRAPKDLDLSQEAYKVGAHLEALHDSLLVAHLDPRYTIVGFNLVCVQVCMVKQQLYNGDGFNVIFPQYFRDNFRTS